MGSILTLADAGLAGKRVLLRVDVNSPLDPVTKDFLDDSRLRRILPTLRKLANARVIILAHQSRPGKVDFTDMSAHSDLLGRLLGRTITFVPDVCGELAQTKIRNMEQGEMLFLDNVRGHTDEWKEDSSVMKNRTFEELYETEIVQKLAPLVDAYVCDAFAAAHRNSPSLSGFGKALPCFAGELMAKEINALKMAVECPPKPYTAILGGVKCDDSIDIANNLCQGNVADTIIPVGAVGNLMLWAAGHSIGEGNENFLKKELGESFDDTWDMAIDLLKNYSERIILPVDVAAEIDGERVDLAVESLPPQGPLFDIGVLTCMKIRSYIVDAGCVLWNGPAGFFEKDPFAFGTIEILNQCCESNGFVIIGGGHTSALVNERKVTHLVGHNSTGGGACLTMLAGRRMPVIEALEISAQIYRDKLIELDLI
ncbi:MAG: phosphoglycerate kinase [Candidatus Thermoplasmatota archaeon]|nr:phosphoglycerate kinase [Candidatus Thermoplasmatota archaeon]